MIAASLALAASGAGATDVALRPGETLLEVQAEGEVMVKPDMALINVGVVSTGTTARDATAANARDMERIVEAIEAAGIGDADIRTRQISVTPRFVHESPADWQGQPEISGYIAINSVAVTVKDLSKAAAVIDAAFDAGANSVNGPSLGLADDSKALADARRDGIAKARAEAETYAESLGMRVARVLKVSERGRGELPIDVAMSDMLMAGGAAQAMAPPVERGELRQTVNVWVDFALVPE